MRIQLGLTLSALALGATIVCAQHQPKGKFIDEYSIGDTIELRTHFVLTDGRGTRIGEATKIVQQIGSTSDRVHILFRSASGDELVIEDGIDYTTQRPETRIRTVNGDAWIASRSKLPFTGKTRADMLEEARRNPKLFEHVSQYELQTNSGTWRIDPEHWEQPERGRLTKDLRRGLTFELLELIQREADGLLASELATVVRMQIVDFLLYRSTCVPAPPVVNLATPDCTFDRDFGFPCSGKQMARAKESIKLGSTPDKY